MKSNNIAESDLRDILDKLKARGFEQRGVSIRIGYDEKGFKLSDALRGKSQKTLNEAYILIQKEFERELGITAPDTDVITMRTLNEKLDRILAILENERK